MFTYQKLPFVDEHGITFERSPEEVWEQLERTAPSTGFRVTESTAPVTESTAPVTESAAPVTKSTGPAKLVLEGRHPFSRYALVFLIEPRAEGGTRAVAQTWAAFPGAAGRVYRALVIGSGIHAVLVRRMLRRLG
jgi:hypothetical protein